MAIEYGDIGRVGDFLSRPDVEIDEKDDEGRTGLAIAAGMNMLDIASLLLEHKANPSRLDRQNHTPLSHAALSGHCDMCAAHKPSFGSDRW
jgi:ankyrin repeat protein